jgi:NAD(P)-dependent dehydrogenase (short-subunit alcohol dehydrogenase family)
MTLEGRVAVVTGANSGLGFETALSLASQGARVVMACRNQEKGARALDEVLAKAQGSSASLASLDLASLDSVRLFAGDFVKENRPIDILVNNAGVMALPERTLTTNGFEVQFGTNHLGHFALTGLLLEALLRSSSPRVVTVTSFAHRTGRMRFSDLQAEHSYRKWSAYGQSKLANLLFSMELARLADAKGSRLVSAAAHPGFAATHLQDGTSFGPLRVFARTPAQGVIPIVHAATATGVRGGDFYGPGVFPGKRQKPIKAFPSFTARDEKIARRLWEVSEDLTGVTYDELGS